MMVSRDGAFGILIGAAAGTLFLAACGLKTNVVMLGPTAPQSGPVPPDSVQLFDGPERVLIGYEAFATISARARATGSAAPYQDDVAVALREAAAGLGADALILDELLDQQGDDPAEGRGTAVRFTHDPGDQGLATGPRWLVGIGTVVVAPVLRTDGPVPDSIAAGFRRDIESRLEAAGFDVIPEAVYDSIRLAHILEVDGLFDPVTGARYDDRARVVEQNTRRELIEQHGVDGYVFAEIRPVRAQYQRSEAEWHGTSQMLIAGFREPSGALRVAAAILEAFICDDDADPDDEDDCERYSGSVAALSLVIRLENAGGATLYTGWGGIEVREMLDPDTGGAYRLTDVPALADPTRSQEAVVIALSGLERHASGGG